MIEYPLEDAPQAVFLHAKAEPLLQDLRLLLEHHYLQAVAHTVDVGRRTVDCQSALAHEENTVRRQVCVCLH